MEKNGPVKSWARFSSQGFHDAIFFTVFFHVTHDGLSERGTTRSLAVYQQKVKYDQDKFEAFFLDVFHTVEMCKLSFLR